MLQMSGRQWTVRHVALPMSQKMPVDISYDALQALCSGSVVESMTRRQNYPEHDSAMSDKFGEYAEWVMEFFPDLSAAYLLISPNQPTVPTRIDEVIVKGTLDVLSVQLLAFLNNGSESEKRVKDVHDLASWFPAKLREQLTAQASDNTGYGQILFRSLVKSGIGRYVDQLHRFGLVTMMEESWRPRTPGRRPAYVTLTPYGTLLVDTESRT